MKANIEPMQAEGFLLRIEGQPARFVRKYGEAYDELLYAGWHHRSGKATIGTTEIWEKADEPEVTLATLETNVTIKRNALRAAQLDLEAAEATLREAQKAINTAFNADLVQA